MESLETKIRFWISGLFNVPVNFWELESNRKNFYSRNYVYYQNRTIKVPSKIFIKYINSDNLEGDVKHYNNEIYALKAANNIKTINHVRSPTVFGENKQLRCVAMEYLEGEPFFNMLWNSSRKHLFIGGIGKRNLHLLSNMAKWLSSFHAYNVKISPNIELAKSIIKDDIKEIEERVNFLNNKGRLYIKKKQINIALQMVNSLSKEIISVKQDSVLTHGDFSLTNMIVNKDELFIIDYSSSQFSFRENDIARILTHLNNICFLRKCNSDIFENDLLTLFIKSYGYEVNGKTRLTLLFFLIKHVIINSTVYLKNLKNPRNKHKLLSFILLYKQKKLLRNICHFYKDKIKEDIKCNW